MPNHSPLRIGTLNAMLRLVAERKQVSRVRRGTYVVSEKAAADAGGVTLGAVLLERIGDGFMDTRNLVLMA